MSDFANPVDCIDYCRVHGEKSASPPDEADRRKPIRRLFLRSDRSPSPTPAEIDAFVKVIQTRGRTSGLVVYRLGRRNTANGGPATGSMWCGFSPKVTASRRYESSPAPKDAWPYRTTLSQAFNKDKPYDTIREQLAGDVYGVDEATGFIVGGPSRPGEKSRTPVLTAQQRADELNDMVGTTGSTFLGADSELCPLPRPQVRPDHGGGVLRPDRLPSPASARRAGCRPAEWDQRQASRELAPGSSQPARLDAGGTSRKPLAPGPPDRSCSTTHSEREPKRGCRGTREGSRRCRCAGARPGTIGFAGSLADSRTSEVRTTGGRG